MYFTILHNKCSIFTGKTKMQIDEKNLKIFFKQSQRSIKSKVTSAKKGVGLGVICKKNEIKMESTDIMERRILSVHVCIIKRNLLSDPKT